MCALTLQACNDDYVDQFDINVSLADATTSTLEMASTDYTAVASNADNKALALSLDPENSTYANALAEVGTNGYFNDLIAASDYLPAYLNTKYVDSEVGSKVTVKYKTYKAPSAYLSDFSNFTTYTLASNDYGAGNTSLNPKTVSTLPDILKSAITDAAEGQKVLVNYSYSDYIPSSGDASTPTYTKVTEFDGAGNYIIAALVDEKYVTFGRLVDESKTYGYSAGESFEATDDVISDASAADYAVTLGESANGYTILNTQGQYLYMKGTFNNFNVSTDVPTSGGEWTVTAKGDGAFNVTNTLSGKSLRYVTPNNNFGAPSYVDHSLLSASWPEGYSVQNVSLAEGLTSVWSISESYGPKATAYASKTNYAAESWVVTSAIDLSSAYKPVVSFDWVARYFSTDATEAFSVLVSTDYAGDVTTANWTVLTIPNLPDGSSWSYINSGDIDLSAFKGKKIYLGFKYTSDTKAATVEFKNLKVNEVITSDYTYYDCYLFKETGSSNKSLSLDYNTTALYAFDGSAWAEYSNADVNLDVMQPATYESIGSASVASSYLPTYLAVNHPYALADDVVAVAYNNGTPVIEEYTFDGAAWATTPNYAVEELTFTKDADGFNANMSSYIEAPLTGGDNGGFTAQNVALSGSISYVWSITSSYGWKASAYASSTNNESEAWLVTPAVNFKKAVAPYMTFDEAHKFLNGDELSAHFSIMVSATYTGDVTTTEWTDITSRASSWSDGQSWDFTNVGEIDLSDFIGNKSVVFAFKYVSTTTAAPTFEVKGFYVKEKTSEE